MEWNSNIKIQYSGKTEAEIVSFRRAVKGEARLCGELKGDSTYPFSPSLVTGRWPKSGGKPWERRRPEDWKEEGEG